MINEIRTFNDFGCDGNVWMLIPVCVKCHNKLHNSRMQSYVEYILNVEG